MEQVTTWSRLMEVIQQHNAKSDKRGHPTIALERMLSTYFVKQWHGLADDAVEDAVYDSQALRQFLAIDLSQQRVPSATTLMGFWHLLKTQNLTQAMLGRVDIYLNESTEAVSVTNEENREASLS